MRGSSQLAAIVLARAAGPQLARLLTLLKRIAGETIVVAEPGLADKLSALDPDIRVEPRAFRNAAEALEGIATDAPWRFWCWADELPDDAALASIARLRDSAADGAFAFALAERWGTTLVRSAAPGLPTARLWRGQGNPLSVDETGLAIDRPGQRPHRAAGGIVWAPDHDVTGMVERVDHDIACTVHAAIAGGFDRAGRPMGAARLLSGWLGGFLRSGAGGRASDRFIATFHHRFWRPLFLNARLHEALEEVAREGRDQWLVRNWPFATGRES